MTNRSCRPPMLALLLTACLAAPVGAVVVDGRLDPEYGASIVTQTVQTSSLDNTIDLGGPDSASTSASIGSELDGAYAFMDASAFHLFLAGNLTSYFSEGDFRDQLQLFFDTGPGGQNVLRADNPAVGLVPMGALNAFAGLTFDPDFAPDYWISVVIPLVPSNTVNAYYATLPAGGGGTGAFLGASSLPGTGTLSGGTNPTGILVSADNANVAGVGSGCAAASGAGVTRGVELSIPFAAIGYVGAGPIHVCAIVTNAYGTTMGNQVLAPLPIGTCGTRSATALDLGAFGGPQYFSYPLGPSPATAATWGRVKAAYR